MKTLNLVKTAFVILALSIIVGCSDQLTSSGDSAPQTNERKVSINDTDDGLPIKVVYRVDIRIKPYRSFVFNSSNTPFASFTSYDINSIVDPNIDKYVIDCENLAVYGTTKDKKYKLSCHEKGLNADQIVIENKSSGFLSLSVVLDGFRAKKHVAVDTE